MEIVKDYDAAIRRVPRWIVILGLIGTGWAGRMGGWSWAGSFLVGAAAAWFNFRLIEKFVNRLGELAIQGAEQGQPKAGRPRAFLIFIRFVIFVLGAFVILKFSGLHVLSALCGLLVCPAAVLAEIFYELITYGYS